MTGRPAPTYFYKVLAADQTPHHGGTGRWVKNQWRTVDGPLEPCRNGIHFCRRDQLVGWLGPAIWLFEDGSPDETVDAGDKMVARRGRVVERIDAWNDVTARLFAADCAEAVLYLIPESHRAPAFQQAVWAARAFARGDISDSERAAAWAAALAAARAAAGDAAWAAARAAAGDAARAAAGDAAWAAAGAAAWAAAGAAAGDAAWAAARAAQTDLLFSSYLEGTRS